MINVTMSAFSKRMRFTVFSPEKPNRGLSRLIRHHKQWQPLQTMLTRSVLPYCYRPGAYPPMECNDTPTEPMLLNHFKVRAEAKPAKLHYTTVSAALPHGVGSLATTEECLLYFANKRQTLKLHDLLALFKRLKELHIQLIDSTTDSLESEKRFNEWSHSPLPTKKYTSSILVRNPSFLYLLHDIVCKLDRLRGPELLSFCQTFLKFGLRDKTPLQIAETHLIPLLTTFSMKQLALIAEIFIHNRMGSQKLCEGLHAIVKQSLDSIDPNSLASLCESFAKSLHKPVQFLSDMLPKVKQMLLTFNESISGNKATRISVESILHTLYGDAYAEQLSLLLYAYTKKINAADEAFLGEAMNCLINRNLSLLSPPSIYRAVWAAPNILKYGESFLIAIEPYILPLVAEMDGRALSTLVWSYSTADVADYRFYECLKQRALQIFKTMHYQGLTNCLFGFAKVLGRTLDAQGEVDVEFLEAAESYLISIMPSLKPKDLVKTASAYALGNCGSNEFYAALQMACVKMSGEFAADELGKILYSFGHTRTGQKIFSIFQVDLLENLNLFSVHSLCDICWSYTVARIYDSTFWEAMLSMLPPSKVLGDDRCALLYPCLLELTGSAPSMKLEKVDVLKMYSKDAFWNLQLLDFPANFAEDVELAIQNQQLPWAVSLCYDFDGYVMDLWVTAEDAEFGIICHTSRTLHKTMQKPLGSAMLKHRYFKKKGVKIINLPWNLWKKCASPDEKIKMLLDGLAVATQRLRS